MAGKSIDEILHRIQQEAQQRRLAEIQRENKLNEIRESQRREWVKQNRIYESLSNQSSTNPSAGGIPMFNWTTYYDTAWLYPQLDIETALYNMTSGASPSTLLGPSLFGLTYSNIEFTKIDDYTYVFPTIDDVVNFYCEMFAQTSITQPIGNVGYSLGKDTRLRSRKGPKITLKLDSDVVIIEMTLMSQITKQSELPSGGNSPDETVGWGSTYVDWNGDGIPDVASDPSPNQYVDPLRFKLV